MMESSTKMTTQCLSKEEEVKQMLLRLRFSTSKSTFVSVKEKPLPESHESFIGFEQEGNLISSINNDLCRSLGSVKSFIHYLLDEGKYFLTC